ncbi:MAG: VWA domain-containing protein, partial [Actinomycetota bacterium]|nr:VWA domain-containing protein [Actinomycetota bacterium]
MIVTLAVLLFSTAAAYAGELTLGIQGADSEAYPDVRLTVTVPAELLGEAQVASFVVTENGREAKVLSQDRLSQPEVPVDVVLAIDTSGSMKGESLEAAKHAAMEFVDAMQSPNRVAIIAFDTTAHVVQGFTDDDNALRAAILGLSAKGETAAYDSLVAAAKLAEEAGSNVKGVVLLSDGGDTMSRTSLDDAVRKTQDAGIPVYAVSLPSFEADPEALRTIASQTGGRQVALSDIAVLPVLYRDIATEIQTSYVVVYQSRRPQTKDLEIEVSTVVGANSASAATVLPNPRFGQSAAEVGDVLKIAPRNLLSFSGAVSLVGLSSILLVVGIALLILR